MTRFDQQDSPDEFRDVEERLREAQPTFTELELDQLKARAMAKASRGKSSTTGRTRGTPMRSRVLTLVLTALLIGGTTAAGIASNVDKGGDAATAQYKPPCDDKKDKDKDKDKCCPDKEHKGKCDDTGGKGDKGDKGGKSDKSGKPK